MKIPAELRFFGFIVLTASIAQLSAEIYLPALPKITSDLMTSPHLVQLSITSFMLGLGVPGIFTGYASDYIGRKKILIAGAVIGIIGTYLCIKSNNVNELIIGRLIQGTGLGSIGNMGRTIIRSKFSGVKLAQYSSYLSIMTILAIDTSPFFGGLIEEDFGWRAIFTLILALSSLSLILNCQYQEQIVKQRIVWANLINSIYCLLKDKNYVIYNLIIIICYATIMAYFSVSSFIVEDVLGYSPQFYGAITIILSLTYITSCYLNIILLRKFSILNILKVGLFLTILSGVMLSTFGKHYTSIYLFMASVVPLFVGEALIWSNSDSIAYLYVKHNMGVASSFANAIRTLGAVVTTWIVSQFNPHSGFTVGILITIPSIISLSFVINDRRQNSEFSSSELQDRNQ